MNSLITLLALAVLTHAFAGLLIKGEDRRWISKVMLIAWFTLFPLLALINLWFPFSGGGDDTEYFYLATMQFDSLADLFDLTKFIGLMEQPGYPWLLSILYQFTGQDLLAFKLLNLAFFVSLLPVWYRIGVELNSRQFGRALALAILLLTPLWYHWMFLLKDMIIALLQSFFLLGAVQISRSHGKGGWLLILAATLALIPFRAPLVLFNVAVLAGTVALMLVRAGQRARPVPTVIMSTIVIGGILSIASNPEWMAAVGIYTEHRVIGSAALAETVSLAGEESQMKRALFPLLYFFTETSGLSPQTWADFDQYSLRGALALPWIFVGVPFFMLGLIVLIRRDPQSSQQGRSMASIRSTRLVATPWGAVVIFILGYMALSWAVGDSTRWRIPDVPAMATVAVAGWLSLAKSSRMQILMLWIASAGGSFALFYLIREL